LPLEVRTALDVTILATEQGTMVTIRPKNSHAALQHLAKNLRLFGDDPLQELGSGLAGLADTLKALAADGARYR
jgi:hypothetical protein